MPGSQHFYGMKPILIRRSFRATSGMPKLVSEDSDVLRCDFVSESAGAMFGPVPLVLILRLQVSLIGVLEILAGTFVSGQVVFFSMALGAGTMSVGSKIMMLSGYLLRFVHNERKSTRVAVFRGSGVSFGVIEGVQDLPEGCRFRRPSWSGHAHCATTRPQSIRPEGRTAPAANSPTRLFPGVGYVATSITRLVPLEVRAIDALGGLSFLSAFWRWAIIAVLRMETVIHVAAEIVGAMKPRARANENFAVKPFRTVVAGRSTVVRSDVIVAVRTIGSRANDDADLSFCFGGGSRDTECSNSALIHLATVRALPRPQATGPECRGQIRSCQRWNQLAVDQLPAGVCLFGGIAVPTG